jgi:hypothetical protein
VGLRQEPCCPPGCGPAAFLATDLPGSGRLRQRLRSLQHSFTHPTLPPPLLCPTPPRLTPKPHPIPPFSIPPGTDLKPILPVLAKVFDQALAGGGAKGEAPAPPAPPPLTRAPPAARGARLHRLAALASSAPGTFLIDQAAALGPPSH